MNGVSTFSWRGRRWELRERRAGPSTGKAVTFHTPAQALARIVALAEDPLARSALLRCVMCLRHGAAISESAVAFELLAVALVHGEVRLSVLAPKNLPGITVADEANTIAPASARAEKLTWIEIRLIDEADEPVSGVGYRIQLSDGRFERGTTNGQGQILYRDIPGGTCELSFDLDEDAWEPIQ